MRCWAFLQTGEMSFDESKGVSAKHPRPQEILDLSYWNTSEDMVRNAHEIWSETYEQVRSNDYCSSDVVLQRLNQLITAV